MKRTIIGGLTLLLITASAFGQASRNRYEVESLTNPNPGKKDTREVNAILMFDNDSVKIRSRRSNEMFKEFKYTDIRLAQHSYSKNAALPMSRRTALALTLLSGIPLFLLTEKKEKHWLTVATDHDFFVLKIENDNYRLIRLEFIVKNIDIVDIDETR